MSRWIEVDAFLKEYCEPYPHIYKAMLRAMADAPSIDIVRCKECEYKSLYDGETKYYYCALEDRPNRQWSVDDTDFCSWGERKDEPQTEDLPPYLIRDADGYLDDFE